MRPHLTVLAWLHVVFGGVWLFNAAGLLLAAAGATTFLGMSGGGAVGTNLLAGGFGEILAVVFVALGVLALSLAYGLGRRRRWARPLGMVAGAVALLSFPLGTCLGVYTLWAMLRRETRDALDGG